MPLEYLSEVKELVRTKISLAIENTNLIEESMSYSALSNSKMIRAGLIFASSEINASLTKNSTITLASSVELMHTYSLIHDDLPCMDDDNLRRGQPSNHVQYGEANAVLSGDALQALAYEIICDDEDMQSEEKVHAIKLLSNACGKTGMIYGQYLDILHENNLENINQDILEKIHNLKTGRLIECSIMLGQIGNDSSKRTQDLLKEFGKKIGLAFQITDDILDVTESEDVLGKNNNSDIKNNKATYVEIVGLDNALQRASDLTNSALSILEKLDLGSKDALVNLARYIIKRSN
jgi:farnesyl diphosphate synthase